MSKNDGNLTQIWPKYHQNFMWRFHRGIPISILRRVKFVDWWFAFSSFDWFLLENEDKNQIWREILRILKKRASEPGGGSSVFARDKITYQFCSTI